VDWSFCGRLWLHQLRMSLLHVIIDETMMLVGWQQLRADSTDDPAACQRLRLSVRPLHRRRHRHRLSSLLRHQVVKRR